MKICPYCEATIEDHYPFCPNCNKPLISNLRDSFIESVKPKIDDSDSPYLILREEDEA